MYILKGHLKPSVISVQNYDESTSLQRIMTARSTATS
jgi:hypothetical protein